MGSSIINSVEHFFSQVSGVIWGWPTHPAPFMVIALVGTGVFLTFRLRFINIRGFGHAIRILKGDYDDPNDPGDVSHFRALTTALSATVGVGNIAGVATAIHYGGPGALFWMWVTAFVGMNTKYAECTLALHYRTQDADGSIAGGPMYTIERGLGAKWKPLAIGFSVCGIISSLATGNAIQAHTMAEAVQSAYGVPTWITGVVSTTVLGLVILGGIRRIGAVTARIIPIMGLLYFVSAIAILAMNSSALPGAFAEIIRGAMTPTAAIGGFVGTTMVSTMIWGVKRGLFSNEAGQGSAPIAHAAAKTEEPVSEGLVALLEPSIDTLLICTLTGLVIITTGAWFSGRDAIYPLTAQSSFSFVDENCTLLADGVLAEQCHLKPGRYAIHNGVVDDVAIKRYQGLVASPRLQDANGAPLNGILVADSSGDGYVVDGGGRPFDRVNIAGRYIENGEPLTAWAFKSGLSPILPFGDKIVTICVFLFALSTAIGWSYYGDRSARYVGGTRAITPYRTVFLFAHFCGAILSHEGVWGFGDVTQGMMALPNLITLVLLSGQVARLTNDYFARQRSTT